MNPLLLTAGAMGASLVFGIAWIIPQIGAQQMTVMLLTGQILSAMCCRISAGWVPGAAGVADEVMGALLMIGGVFLATAMIRS